MAAVQGAESLLTFSQQSRPLLAVTDGRLFDLTNEPYHLPNLPSSLYIHLVFPAPDSHWVFKSLYSGLFCLIKRVISLLNHLSAFGFIGSVKVCLSPPEVHFLVLCSLNYRGKYQVFRSHMWVHVAPS